MAGICVCNHLLYYYKLGSYMSYKNQNVPGCDRYLA